MTSVETAPVGELLYPRPHRLFPRRDPLPVPSPPSPNAACRFCEIIGRGEIIRSLSLPGIAAVFPNIRPHSPGHLLVIPWKHVADAAEDPEVTGRTAAHAAGIISRDLAAGKYDGANLMTSVREAATQGVFHLHWHIVPRWPQDGLCKLWPWCCGPQWT